MHILICLLLFFQGLRFFQENNPNFADRKGAVLVFDLNQPEKDTEVAKIRGNLDMNLFNPYGITSWTDKSGNVSCLNFKCKRSECSVLVNILVYRFKIYIVHFHILAQVSCVRNKCGCKQCVHT